MTALVAVLALAAGGLFALSAAVQHQAAQATEQTRLGDPRLLLRLAGRPTWLVANLLDLIAVVAQTAALHSGTLIVVQPLLTFGLILAVPAEAMLNHRRVSRRDLLAVVVGTVALAGFVGLAAPTGGLDDPGLRAWIATLAIGGLAATVGVAASRMLTGAPRAAALGIATGTLYGLSAALLKACSAQLTQPLNLLVDWHFYALIVVALVALQLNQHVFQAGGLAVGLTAMSLTEPIVAVAIGATAFGEQLDATGLQRVGIAATTLGILASVTLLATRQQSEGAHHQPRSNRETRLAGQTDRQTCPEDVDERVDGPSSPIQGRDLLRPA